MQLKLVNLLNDNCVDKYQKEKVNQKDQIGSKMKMYVFVSEWYE